MIKSSKDKALELRDLLKREFPSKAESIPLDELEILINRSESAKYDARSKITAPHKAEALKLAKQNRESWDKKDKLQPFLYLPPVMGFLGGVAWETPLPLAAGITLSAVFFISSSKIKTLGDKPIRYDLDSFENNLLHQVKINPVLNGEIEKAKKEIDVALREEIIKRYDLRPQA